MRRLLIGLAALAAASFGLGAEAAPDARPLVATSLGPVRGVVEDGIATFRGIPFAAPPVGALRWRPPQPAARWTSVRDAAEFGPACMQGERVLFPEDKVQSEDCLTVNVWAPAGAKPGALPVMVWIYGGGFSQGSTRPPLYSGRTFARDGVVMVSLQYRVGRFGFFAHPAISAEGGTLGNYGIMDQIAALKWVQKNVGAFGGDPKNVTIFGESAGGISINGLMATPAARGLFAKAISESGFGRTVGIPIHAASGPSGEAQGVAFAEAHGVKGDGPDAAKALRALSAEEVLRQAAPAGPPAGQTRQPGGAPGGLPFPFIDGALFKEQISQTFAAGRQAPVPYLAGGNSFEASLFAFVRNVPQQTFGATGAPDRAQALYVAGGRDAGLGALDLVTDLQVTEPARKLARDVIRSGHKAFLYEFSYLPQAQRATAPGASHGGELGYVFGVLTPGAAPETQALSNAMHAYWVAFAKTGAPRIDGKPAWPAVTAESYAFMEFGAEGPTPRSDYHKAKLDFAQSVAEAKPVAQAAGSAGTAAAAQAAVGRTIDPGKTGFAVKRPVMAAACPNGCPWGELGEFTAEAARPLGYEVILCRNCNRAEGPRIVANGASPPPLTPGDLPIGTVERVEAPVDFGVTESGLLNSAYLGTEGYAKDGPYRNLRLIAKIEDPTYLLVAVKRSSGITDLARITERHMAVKIISAGGAADAVLAHYGLTREAVTGLGGSLAFAMGARPPADPDVIVSDLGSPSNNPESAFWSLFTQRGDYAFLQLPDALLDDLARTPGAQKVTVRWGLLRGLDRPIRTVGRSGEAIFARADTPDQAAYDLARAIDAHRGDLKWFIRPYSYDPRTVAQNLSVPLHPGAARYYRERGYIAGLGAR